jgi:hypothetical protein
MLKYVTAVHKNTAKSTESSNKAFLDGQTYKEEEEAL